MAAQLLTIQMQQYTVDLLLPSALHARRWPWKSRFCPCSGLWEHLQQTLSCCMLSPVTWLQLVHLVRSLRAAGHFTAVAVTKPFEFEGQRKLEAAERLLAALEEAAHLVVVVEQVGCSPPACSC